jgi:hypothetical protein
MDGRKGVCQYWLDDVVTCVNEMELYVYALVFQQMTKYIVQVYFFGLIVAEK